MLGNTKNYNKDLPIMSIKSDKTSKPLRNTTKCKDTTKNQIRTTTICKANFSYPNINLRNPKSTSNKI